MIDLSKVSYGEILDCIVDASLGRLSPYFQEYARHEIASLANVFSETVDYSKHYSRNLLAFGLFSLD